MGEEVSPFLSTLADNGRVFPGKIGTSVHPSRSDLYYVAITSEELCRLLSCCVRYNACATLPDSVVDYRISMRRAKRAFTSRVADCSYQEPRSATLRFTPLLTEARVNEYARCADRIHRR
jgi:hypothetical protein